MLHDEAIFDGSGLAFIGITDHVLLVSGTVAYRLPLCAAGEAGAAHAAQSTRLELRNHTREVARLHQSAKHAVLLDTLIRVRLKLLAEAFRTRVRQRFTAQVADHDLSRAVAGNAVVNLLLRFGRDQQRRSSVTPAQAGNFANTAIGAALSFQPVFQLLLKHACAAKVARHVGADPDIHAGGGLEVEV